jgi:hypothetical protein
MKTQTARNVSGGLVESSVKTLAEVNSKPADDAFVPGSRLYRRWAQDLREGKITFDEFFELVSYAPRATRKERWRLLLAKLRLRKATRRL